ncbi:MAG TPA: glycosyltransferase family 4 protein [Vicinamibacterales bacterium]|nr:glycosyltransferase family 4 protein [Vicinamibacterales bacterium]
MRILHLATFLQGGAGRAVTDLALQQHAGGHDVRVVASRSETPGYGNYPAYLQSLRDARVPLLLVDSLFHRDYAANLNAVQQIDRAIGAVPPDVIHAHAAVPAMMAMLLSGSRRDAVPVMSTMHGWSATKTPAQSETDVRVLNLVHRVATPSAHSAALLQDAGVDPGRIHVVPYGVGKELPALSDRDERAAAEMRDARRDGRFVVACVGTVGERKRQRLLIEALGHLEDPRACLVVFIGDGDTSALQSAAESFGVQDSVAIHGYSAAARRLGTEADALALPSSREGQPLSILEAFCDGTPVIASDIPELAEMIDDGENGWLFAPDSAESLARTIEDVMHASPLDRDHVARRARERYRDRHALGDMTHRYMTHYTDLAFDDRGAGFTGSMSGSDPELQGSDPITDPVTRSRA